MRTFPMARHASMWQHNTATHAVTWTELYGGTRGMPFGMTLFFYSEVEAKDEFMFRGRDPAFDNVALHYRSQRPDA